ncbi:MAG: cysteine synthase A [Clostridiales bacterium]|nr:cysteine synthase A [Clostridiales bacterium]
MKIRNTVTELIGGTPLLRLGKMEKKFGTAGELVAKVEFFNPAGSIKDRVGYNMVIEAEKDGRLKPGGTIIEPTSGNTGVGIAMTAAARGYKAIMVMPESMSMERRMLLAAFGAELVLTDKEKGMQGSVEKAQQLAEEIPGSIIAGQFENPANPQAHYETTGPEIWADTDGQVDILVATFGTGGTVSGVGKYLKEKNPDIKVVAIEPAASPLITAGKAGPHKIQGIGANFIPEVLDRSVIDEVMTVTDDDALDTMKALAVSEGLLVGVSSGAAVYGASQVAARPENEGKRIVVILPDTGERYLSIFQQEER